MIHIVAGYDRVSIYMQYTLTSQVVHRLNIRAIRTVTVYTPMLKCASDFERVNV